MIMNENEIINKLVPGFLEDIADENTKKLFSKYAYLYILNMLNFQIVVII